MRKVKALSGLVVALMLLIGLNACGDSTVTAQCKTFESTIAVCWHDISLSQMHTQAASVSPEIELINFIPQDDLKAKLGMSTDTMLEKAKAYPNLAPDGWKISGVSVTKSGKNIETFTITFNRLDHTTS